MNIRNTILVVDDHDSIRLLLGTMLSKDYNVVTLTNGFDAISWLSEGNIPDLILLDLGMPEMDGFEFLQNIRHSGFFQNIPVLVISANEEEDMATFCKEQQVAGYFAKPFNPISLREQIKSVVQQKTVSSLV